MDRTISGNINILQLTSDVWNYTILLQLYNFVGIVSAVVVIQLLLYHCLAVKSPTERRKSVAPLGHLEWLAAQFTGALLAERLIML